jgi:hypothetical protein
MLDLGFDLGEIRSKNRQAAQHPYIFTLTNILSLTSYKWMLTRRPHPDCQREFKTAAGPNEPSGSLIR